MQPTSCQDSFENESLSNIWSSKLLTHGSFKIQSKFSRDGNQAIEIRVREGDMQARGGSGQLTERSEITEQPRLWSTEENNYCYSFSILLPKNFPIIRNRLVLAQWKQHDSLDAALVNNPIIALRYAGGELYITLQTSKDKLKLFSTNKEVRGKWIDFMFNVRFSRKDRGFIRICMNGKEIVNYIGKTAYSLNEGYSSPGHFYFKMGLYRDTSKLVMNAYFDEYSKRELSKDF